MESSSQRIVGDPILIESNGAIFVRDQIAKSHGHDGMDLVGQEAFVNHALFSGADFQTMAENTIETWKYEMKRYWHGKVFRIYRQVSQDEIILRFHLVREGVPNWCDDPEPSLEIINVRT